MNAFRLVFFGLLLSFSFTVSAQRTVERYPNGEKKYQGRLDEGVKVGTHKYWFENGELQKLERYSDTGILIRVKTYDESGELISDEKPEEAMEALREKQFETMKWLETKDGVAIHKLKGDQVLKPSAEFNNYVVHYAIYLTNGQEVESSFRKNVPLPIDLQAGGMIDGFLFGLKHFNQGDNGFIKIPNRLAYGSQSSKTIPAYSDLIFQIMVLRAN